MTDLGTIRQEIDEIDREIVEAFEKRMELCRQVAEVKIGTGKAVLDRGREREKLETLAALASDEFNAHGVTELFSQIMAMSRKLQYRILTEHGKLAGEEFVRTEGLPSPEHCVAYQGVEGAYSHAAACRFFGEKAAVKAYPKWADVMQAVASGEADYGVLPLANSSAGMVNDVYDLLIEYRNYIVGEVELKVEHALLGLPGASLPDIQEVYSHPQGLMQCAHYLDRHPDWNRHSVSNTALSAKKVLEDGKIFQAAIASRLAGELYGLQVLESPVNDSDKNTTRFIVVCRKNLCRTDAGKVSICFEVPHESGSLYNILSHFIYNNINMNKIESRPIPEKKWQYRFFVDFDGNLADAGVQNALTGIRQEAAMLRILGNY